MIKNPVGAHVKLEIEDLVEGKGPEAHGPSWVTVHYTGWLLDGTKFDSSVDRGQTFTFELGRRRVIAGWDMGVEGMKVGGTRRLIIPPSLAYGAPRNGPLPPYAALLFEIQLVGVTTESQSAR